MKKIEATFDGQSPQACYGRLVIAVDGQVIYSRRYCCVPSDSRWCCSGRLVWKDADNFGWRIRRAVKKALKKAGICHGGCI